MVSCSQIPPQLVLPDQPKVCCVFRYDEHGGPIVGTRTCTPIGDNQGGQDETITAGECTGTVTYYTAVGAAVNVPYGEIQECCRDCNPPPLALVVSNGRLVRNVDSNNKVRLSRSPNAEPEQCCCGDECVCKQVPDCEQVRCYPTHQPTDDDKCRGRCVIRTYDAAGNEIFDDRTMICATKTQCCAEDNTTCAYTCVENPTGPGSARADIPPANQWDSMPCTNCAVCCVHNYDSDPASPTFRQSLSKTGTRALTKEECEALTVVFFPNPAPLPVGVWHPGTDNLNICNPSCCQNRTYGDKKEIECAPTSERTCDPCLGRCTDVKRETSTTLCPVSECKTKQGCCGDGNEKCTPQCGEQTARYRWEPVCASDGDKCGICCRYIWDDTTGAPNSPINNYLDIVCDRTTETKAVCERFITLPSGVNRAYGFWTPFGTCAACKSVPCCREVVCSSGATSTTCVNVAPEDCDVCNGTCTEIATGNEFCATRFTCCGPDDINCTSGCGLLPTHRWAVGCANPYECGVCCRTLFSINQTNGSESYFSHQCFDNNVTRQTCVLTEAEADFLSPTFRAVYDWHAFALSCEGFNCRTKKCCGETCPQDVGCIDINIEAECDPCKGRCVNKATGEKLCKTKQDCCGVDGALCRGCPAPGPGPAFEWSGCFENGFKCGVCCQLTLNAANVAVSSECLDNITYEECIARPNASWKAFETCASAVCIPRACCNDVECPGQTICIAVDKQNGVCPDFCRDECYAIDATGDQISDSFCATKFDCCGPSNEQCIPVPGFCPDSSPTVPTYHWQDIPDHYCADPDLCGVCCKRNVGPGGAISFSCDDTKNNRADCTAANYGVWHEFATCAVCGDTKQACVEARCKKIININGQPVEQIYSHAACKPVAPNQTNCKGICTEFSTVARPYESKTCKTKSDCCGPNNIRCGDGCGTASTHAWSQACIDPEQCGVCCITNNIGAGPVPGPPQENIGRAACEALNTAGGGLGNTAIWIPFGTARDCTVERCCGSCPDGSIKCLDVVPPAQCLQPCNGRCYTVDAAGNEDLTQPATCATKAACCIQGGINVCQNECSPGKRWAPTCPENAIKCGVACKTTLGTDGTTIVASVCQPGISTYAQYLVALATLAANETLEWKPWDTCATVICRAKKCCKEVCPGVFGCATVDVSDPCTKCEGLCYDAVVDPNTGAHSIAPGAVPECSMRVACCGAGNENCAETPNCPQDNPKVFVPCCDDDVFAPCQCGSPNEAANLINNTYSIYYNQPPSGQSVLQDRCFSRLAAIGGPGNLSFPGGEFLFNIPNSGIGPGNGSVNRWDYTPTYETPCAPDPARKVPTFSWNECYPDLIQNENIYVFRTHRSGAYNWANSAEEAPVGYDTYKFSGHSRVSFYVCRGKKLVDISDKIMTMLPVPACIYEESKRFETRCRTEVLIIETCDCAAINFPCDFDGQPNVDLTPLGFGTGWKYGGRYSFCGPQNKCSAFLRCRHLDDILADQRNGVAVPPMAETCGYAEAGSARYIYQWYAQNRTDICTCPQTIVPPPTSGQNIQTTIQDAFNSISFAKESVDWADDGAGLQDTIGNNGFLIPAKCCRLVSVTRSYGLDDNITHPWQKACALPGGNLADGRVFDDNMTGCPQPFTANPLP